MKCEFFVFLYSRVPKRTYCAGFAERDTMRAILAQRSTAPWSLLLGRREINLRVTDPGIQAPSCQEEGEKEWKARNIHTLTLLFSFLHIVPKVPIQTRTVDESGMLRTSRVCVSGGVRGPNFARCDKGHAHALSQ